MTTFKERAVKEHPRDVSNAYNGGVRCCPYHYKYETEGESVKNCTWNNGKGCTYCWNREIPYSVLPTNELKPDGLTVLKSDYYEQLQAVEKKCDCLCDFIQSRGLDEEYKKWLKRNQGGRYTEKPQLDEPYWFIDHDGDAIYDTWNNYDTDKYRWLNMSLWKTDKDALRHKEIQTFIKERARPYKLDKANCYLVLTDESVAFCDNDCVAYHDYDCLVYPNVDYFDKEVCEEIINTIGVNDLKKYYFLRED